MDSEKELQRLARDAYRDAEGDVGVARQDLYKQIREDESGLLIDASVWLVSDDLIRSEQTAQRSRCLRRAPKPDTAEGLEAVAHRRAQEAIYGGRWDLLNTPIWGNGRQLGDALRPELLESAERYISYGQGHVIRGTWQKRIAERLPDDDTPVREVFDDHAIGRILREVEGIPWPM